MVSMVHRTLGIGAQSVWARRCYNPQSVWRMAKCDARPTVTFLASEQHRPSIRTKLYCLLAYPGPHSTAQWVRLEPATSRSWVQS